MSVNLELLEALRLATKQNSFDMLMTGEELRKCEAAIAHAEAAMCQGHARILQWCGGGATSAHLMRF